MTLASAATAATGFSPGFEVTQDLGLAHAAGLEVFCASRAQTGQERTPQLDWQLLWLAQRHQQPRELSMASHEHELFSLDELGGPAAEFPHAGDAHTLLQRSVYAVSRQGVNTCVH